MNDVGVVDEGRRVLVLGSLVEGHTCDVGAVGCQVVILALHQTLVTFVLRVISTHVTDHMLNSSVRRVWELVGVYVVVGREAEVAAFRH